MDVRVLGPLEVVDGGRPVGLGGPMQRAVLALLALEPGRVVSLDRLVDGLWGEAPPARAAATVQAYVSNLRRALEPGRRRGEPAGVLVGRPPGYLLQVEPADVDWLRFGELVERARVARAAGRPDTADELYAAAAALWRGPALGDLAGILAAEGARLEERRLAAVEEHSEVRLGLGPAA